jgi:phage FluMu protein gp41
LSKQTFEVLFNRSLAGSTPNKRTSASISTIGMNLKRQLADLGEVEAACFVELLRAFSHMDLSLVAN